MRNYSTPKQIMKPKEKTLQLIKQIAYTYRVMKINGKQIAYCLN
jgi:hypothetical protein